MRLPDHIRVFGDPSFRGKCATENADMVTLVSFVRRQWPKTWGVLGFHPRNEGQRTWGQAAWQKSEGMTEGTVDFIIPARVPLVLELKRKDRTQSKWQKGQVEYLTAAQDAGAFACIALGYEAAIEAVKEWNKLTTEGQ